MEGVFVTGTGTEVGKTVVAAAIARTLAAAGREVAVFKPAVTGLDDPGEPDHALLRRAAGSAQSDEQIAPYRYGPPASPHLAAALAGEEIDPDRLRAAAAEARRGADALVCEGVGGLLVPLSPGYLVRDLAADLGAAPGDRRLAGAGDDQPHAADDRGGAERRARGGDGRAHSLAASRRPRSSAPTARRSPPSAR